MEGFDLIDNLPVYIGLASVILILLAAYAWQLHHRVKALEEKQRSEAEEAEIRRQEQKYDASRGIRILAGAMIREEVTLTEGCMRIAFLLTQVDSEARDKREYSVYFQLAEATAHIPVLEAWQNLSKQEKKAYDKERIDTEAAFQEFVLEAAEQLLHSPMLT